MSVSLSSILNIATSGLEVAQTGLNTVSNNISNVNTAGYVREVVNQGSLSVGGQGIGVSVQDIARTTNQFLEAANLKATADSSGAGITSSMLDQAQSLFGDPTSTSSFFGQLDSVFSAFSTLSSSPSSTAGAAAVSQITQFLSSSQAISAGLGQLGAQADAGITSDVTTANALLSQIAKLNGTISQATVSGGDATGAQNQQSALIGQLSGLMNVNVSTTATGGVTVKASDGTVLASDQGAATLSYDGSGATGQIIVTPVGGAPQALGARLSSGELAGLVSLRNTELPSISSQLATLTSQTAVTLNQVSNSYSSVPAPPTLAGRNTGMDLTSDVSNFTGQTTVGVVNGAGVLQSSVAIDFSAGTMIANGGTPVGFTPASFLSTLNSQLGGAATASFSNGALSISAASASNGVVVADDATAPSSKAGQTFSDFFGLNDLVSSATPADYATGLTAASASGYPAGQSISFRLTGADGSTLKDVTVQTPAGGAMADLVNALNSPTSGVGLYGAFQLDAQGQLSFTATGGSGVSLSVQSDATANTATGTSISQLFGIGSAARTAAAGGYAVRSDIAANPGLLQTSAVTLGAASGTSVLAAGDTSGADAFATAGQTSIAFAAAGQAAAGSTTLSGYASNLSGDIATKAAAADSAATSASAVATETQTRLSSAEGVNVDQEMISLTTYQQAYNASARLIQATSSMFTTLMSITSN
ncbi:flagellar hook-associated protein FlgK [Caulobacter sp. S45]|uniref:flagellar hook-associated protein FlgK n=1 Tax=Caulobacter sp. S45 TaxID=1641861 RepID=UPI0015767888|nr:flagellar hook-associated protein FlgK [Caulobacter sp. S45]